jgi:hypothetical protein
MVRRRSCRAKPINDRVTVTAVSAWFETHGLAVLLAVEDHCYSRRYPVTMKIDVILRP